mgnify:CR=1 FL=1
MPFDFTDQLEQLVQATGPEDLPEIPALPGPDTASEFDLGETVAPVPPADLLSESAFHDQFAMIHDMAGGMVQMRTGAPCPLGDQARGEGGRQAASAIYALAMQNAALARLFLSTKSTFFGQLAAIGMHGFSCVQIVKTSAMTGQLAEQEAEQ